MSTRLEVGFCAPTQARALQRRAALPSRELFRPLRVPQLRPRDVGVAGGRGGGVRLRSPRERLRAWAAPRLEGVFRAPGFGMRYRPEAMFTLPGKSRNLLIWMDSRFRGNDGDGTGHPALHHLAVAVALGCPLLSPEPRSLPWLEPPVTCKDETRDFGRSHGDHIGHRFSSFPRKRESIAEVPCATARWPFTVDWFLGDTSGG